MKAQNIFLIGLMGSGKTTIGKTLAKKIDKQFIDTDQFIEQKSGVEVSIIFEYEGESGFRDRETKLLSSLTQKGNQIISTGGGIILTKENRDLIAKNGIVFYLKTHPKVLSQRLKNDKTRPLLKNMNIEEKLNSLYQERSILYESTADYIIDTKEKKILQILNEIEKKIISHENHSN